MQLNEMLARIAEVKSSYEREQQDIHTANTSISSWHNCPCDSCRERQAATGIPLAEYYSQAHDWIDFSEYDKSYSEEPPF
jgi:hypothetical protein